MLAQEEFKSEFFEGQTTSPPAEGKIVLRESKAQVELAQVVIKHSNQADVRSIATHVCSSILLNEMVHNVEKYVDRALLNSTEAENLIHPLEVSLKQLSQCSGECIDAAAAELSSHHQLGVEKAVIGGEKDEEMDV